MAKTFCPAIRGAICSGIDGAIGMRALFRLSNGSRSRALEIVKKLVPHYTTRPITDPKEFELDFDIVCAELVDGTEVEWPSE